MLLRKLVVVGLVGLVSFAANIATAEDAGAPGSNFVGVDGVNFVDPSEVFSDNRFELRIGEGGEARFANLAPIVADTRRRDDDFRRAEVALTARGSAGFDVSFAQRAGIGFDRQGDVQSQSRGSELRFVRTHRNRTSRDARWYIFAASEDEALTWGPATRNDFGGLRSSFGVQDRVEIGDMQAGITYERDGWQASLAYVERRVNITTSSGTIGHDENFTGVTWTMRH